MTTILVLSAVLAFVVGFFLGEKFAFRQIKVKIEPFCRTDNNNLLFWKSVNIEYGYRLRIYIKGLPSLQSGETILKQETRRDISKDELLEITEAVTRTAISALGGVVGVVSDRVLTNAIEKPTEIEKR